MPMAVQGGTGGRGAAAAPLLRVKPVDVLGRVDGVLDLVGVQPGRQRKLDQDAVDALVGVELGHRASKSFREASAGSLPLRPDARALLRPLPGAE